MKMAMGAWSLLLVLGQCVLVAYASKGDTCYVFHKCMKECVQVNCSAETEISFYEEQPLQLHLMSWSCKDECDYACMWTTVTAFEKDGSPIPQFHGKWPFIRMLGVQEPASAIFSFLNGLAHFLGLCYYRRYITSKAPMYWVVHYQVLSTVHVWVWSLIFHSRDFPFTEKMDYFCAISGVLTMVFVLCVRIVGTRKEDLWKLSVCAVALISFFAYHVNYLAFVFFDYGYNMRVNIAVGAVNSVGWLAWCLVVCTYQPYVWMLPFASFSSMPSSSWSCVIFLLFGGFLTHIPCGISPPHSFPCCGTVILLMMANTWKQIPSI